MKTLMLLSVLVMSANAFGIATKKCPSEFKIELRNFRSAGTIAPSRDNPNLPFAYIAMNEGSFYFSETLKLTRAKNAVCTYKGEKIRAQIEGSLRKGAKTPAVLKSYFSVEHSGLRHRLVAYSPIKNITKDKAIELKGSGSEVYFRGENCSFGDCIPDYFKVGFATSTLYFSQEFACMSQKDAEKTLIDYLSDWGGSELIFQDDIDEDIYYFDLRDSTDVKRYAKTLSWTGTHYVTDNFYNFECAPSADCWGWHAVTCTGEVAEEQDGED